MPVQRTCLFCVAVLLPLCVSAQDRYQAEPNTTWELTGRWRPLPSEPAIVAKLTEGVPLKLLAFERIAGPGRLEAVYLPGELRVSAAAAADRAESLVRWSSQLGREVRLRRPAGTITIGTRRVVELLYEQREGSAPPQLVREIHWPTGLGRWRFRLLVPTTSSEEFAPADADFSALLATVIAPEPAPPTPSADELGSAQFDPVETDGEPSWPIAIWAGLGGMLGVLVLAALRRWMMWPSAAETATMSEITDAQATQFPLDQAPPGPGSSAGKPAASHSGTGVPKTERP